jgi:alkaline phosphatase
MSDRRFMMRKYFSFIIVFLIWSISSCATLPNDKFEKRSPVYPKSIILLIGDGMGVSHITAGKIVKGVLNLESFRYLGLLTTYSQDAFVTDSAAAGTAMATGYKTCNGAISVSSNKEPLKTVIEYAEENGKSTGLVTTCSLTHATPAVFVAHVERRTQKDLIAEHIAKSDIDVLFGGGWSYFVPKSVKESRRADEKDLIAILKKRMKVIRSVEEFQQLGVVDSVAGFFAAKHPPQAKYRKPQLHELTRKAIEILSRNKAGFFLMVEGSQIDWAAHKNKQEFLLAETIDFDNAVGVALEFARSDSETLVLATADHETGGFAIHDGSVEEKRISNSGFTTKEHTAAMVPIFAYGPGSLVFSGIKDNTIIGKTIIQYLRQ